jgi:AP-1-like factor
MPYPAFPMQYGMAGDGITPMGLIPVELDIEGLYEDHDRRRRKNGSEKTVSSHVHSVSTYPKLASCRLLMSSSAAVLRIEHHNELSVTEKRSTCVNSSRN